MLSGPNIFCFKNGSEKFWTRTATTLYPRRMYVCSVSRTPARQTRIAAYFIFRFSRSLWLRNTFFLCFLGLGMSFTTLYAKKLKHLVRKSLSTLRGRTKYLLLFATSQVILFCMFSSWSFVQNLIYQNFCFYSCNLVEHDKDHFIINSIGRLGCVTCR